MRDFWKQTAVLAAVGFILGLLVGLGILLIGGGDVRYAPDGVDRTSLYLVLSGLLGAVNMGAATIYSLEHWGILRCTLTHFILTMSSVCAVGFTLGWLRPGEPATLWMLGGCVVAYGIIWLVMYIRYKRQIGRINEALERWKNEQNEE